MSPMKSQAASAVVDHVAWARRINGRWIVHHGLNRDAEAYLKLLERTAPERLRRSCLNARLLTPTARRWKTPSPGFYAGLFSLATEAEVRQFLADHWLVATAVAPAEAASVTAPALENVSDATLENVRHIREALTRLPKP
jgi:hypothetical protein